MAISSSDNSALKTFAREYSMRAVDDAPFAPLPLPDQSQKEDEEALKARMKRLSYEIPAADWRALPCIGEPSDAPQRFIDGSVFSRTVAVLTIGGSRRPCILGALGALALRISGRSLVRASGSLRMETVLCVLSNGMSSEHLSALGQGLAAIGVNLVSSETKELGVDFEVLRRRCWDIAKDRMEEAERQVLLDEPNVPAVVDGLLERRLTTVQSQSMPAVGVVKRPGRQYLPASHLNLMYGLRPGERTPAFLLETEYASLVSWYLRLSDAAMTSPSYGVVRITLPQEYLERRFTTLDERSHQISALSAYLFTLRHRQGSYPRAGISLEPIVRVEDELHALLPDIRQQAARLHRALGI